MARTKQTARKFTGGKAPRKFRHITFLPSPSILLIPDSYGFIKNFLFHIDICLYIYTGPRRGGFRGYDGPGPGNLGGPENYVHLKLKL